MHKLNALQELEHENAPIRKHDRTRSGQATASSAVAARWRSHILILLLTFLACAAAHAQQCRVTNIGVSNTPTFSPYSPTVTVTTNTTNPGSTLVNAPAPLSRVGFEDGLGLWHDASVPASPANSRWLLNPTVVGTSSTLTFTFSSPVPANWIGLAIQDIGDTQTMNPYSPTVTLTLSGSGNTATRNDFTLSRFREVPANGVPAIANSLTYSSTSGVVSKTNPQRTVRESGVLRGTSDALVKTLTLSVAGAGQLDSIGFFLFSIPSCITLSKISNGAVGSFTIGSTNLRSANVALLSSTVLSTTTPGTAAPATPGYASLIGAQSELTETIPPGWALTNASCIDNNASITGNPGSFGTLLAGKLTIPAINVHMESDIICTFTNDKLPVLRLRKQLPIGRFNAGDQFTLSVDASIATTTGTGSNATETVTLTPSTVATIHTFSEAAVAGTNLSNYATTYSCTNDLIGGQTPSGAGTSFSLTSAPGDDVTCTFVNTRNPKADLSISKTNTPSSGELDQETDSVTSGTSTTYVITVRNGGPDTVNNALVKDTPSGGLGCSSATCIASPGAACPTAPLDLNALLGSGLAIPTLPANSSVTISLTCAVP